MARSIILVSCLLAFLLLFAGCTQKTEPVVVQQPPAEQPSANLTNATVQPAAPCSTGNIVQKDDCFYALAQGKNDPGICKNIYSVDRLDSCYAMFADSNLEICKTISDADMKAKCLLANAKSQESEEICKLIEDEQKRGECLVEVLPPCMAIMDPDQRNLCLALEKGTYTLCTSDGCLQAYAKNKSDENACALISVQVDRYVCMALVRSNVAACKEAALSPVQDSCVEKAAELLDDSGSCYLATAQTDYSNRCYLHFAIERQDPSICAHAAPEEKRDDCYANYSIAAANISSCLKIQETLNKLGCYYHAAAANRMPSLCNPLGTIIGTGSQRADCYTLSILTEKGPMPSDCPLVDSAEWKDKCYYTAARITYNSTLCGFINPGSNRDNCDALFS
ncbi:Uncharacterised protein [uncultured archaeon]|nr:Uncharacterised protein [uncultured archaeon]